MSTSQGSKGQRQSKRLQQSVRQHQSKRSQQSRQQTKSSQAQWSNQARDSIFEIIESEGLTRPCDVQDPNLNDRLTNFVNILKENENLKVVNDDVLRIIAEKRRVRSFSDLWKRILQELAEKRKQDFGNRW